MFALWLLSMHVLFVGFSEENNDIRALSPLVRRFARRAQGRVDYINVDVDEADTNGKILTELKTRGMKA